MSHDHRALADQTHPRALRTFTLWAAVAALLLAMPAARLARAQETPTATLTTLTPTAQEVLTPPTNVQGDFEVAAKPPTIDFAILPGQIEGAELWSNWGDALAYEGKFYCSIGDHDAPFGRSLVYRLDPQTGKVDLVVDFNKAAGITSKDKYAPGKIHGPLMDGGDGWIYFIGYRGSVRQTTAEQEYEGDLMLRYNPDTGAVENLGIPVPYCSVPTSIIDKERGVLYGLAAPGKTSPTPEDRFFAYDLKTKELIFTGDVEPNISRAIIFDRDGNVYYSAQNKLVKYVPGSKKISTDGPMLPGDGKLRAASDPDKNGLIYGITNSGMVFSFDPAKQSITPIAPAFVAGKLYTAVCKLDPTGRYLYYIPAAHGGSDATDTAIIRLDLATGRPTVVAFLNKYISDKTGYHLGGTFGIALSPDGKTLMVCFNGGPKDAKKNEFGSCSVMLLHMQDLAQ